MSQENVEVVRRAFEASRRHDNEVALALYDPEVVLHYHVDGSVYRGLTGVRALFGDWFTTWDELTYDTEGWIDAGDDVIAALHVWARGKQSGAPVERREWHVWTLPRSVGVHGPNSGRRTVRGAHHERDLLSVGRPRRGCLVLAGRVRESS